MTEFGDRAEKILAEIQKDFERAASEEDKEAAAMGIISTFGITLEDFAELSLRITAFFTLMGMPMDIGIQVCLLLGMCLGRDLDQDIRLGTDLI